MSVFDLFYMLQSQPIVCLLDFWRLFSYKSLKCVPLLDLSDFSLWLCHSWLRKEGIAYPKAMDLLFCISQNNILGDSVTRLHFHLERSWFPHLQLELLRAGPSACLFSAMCSQGSHICWLLLLGQVLPTACCTWTSWHYLCSARGRLHCSGPWWPQAWAGKPSP